MKETNFYTGIYKIIAVIVCLMLYATISKAKADSVTMKEKNNIEIKLFTNP